MWAIESGIFYCQHFPVNFTVYGNFYGNFQVKGLFFTGFTVVSCKITVNRKNDVEIYVKNLRFPVKNGNFFSEQMQLRLTFGVFS